MPFRSSIVSLSAIIAMFVTTIPTAVVHAQSEATTAPAKPVEQLFSDDTLSFTVPPGWRVSHINETTNAITLAMEEPHAEGGVLTISTAPQTASLTQNPDTKAQLGKAIVDMMTNSLVTQGIESIDPPKVKHDTGFFLRIEDIYKSDGKVVNRLNIYRVLGIHLLNASVTSFSDDKAETARLFKLAEMTLARVRPNKLPRVSGVPTGQKPGLFRLAKVKLTTTKGWLETRTDRIDGTISTFRQQVGGSFVTVRVEPMEAQAQDRDVVLERVAKEELAGVTQSVTDTADTGAKIEEGEVTITRDANGLSLRLTQKTVRTGLTFLAETRARVLGTQVLAVTSLATELRAIDEVTAWADELFTTAEPFPMPK